MTVKWGRVQLCLVPMSKPPLLKSDLPDLEAEHVFMAGQHVGLQSALFFVSTLILRSNRHMEYRLAC